VSGEPLPPSLSAPDSGEYRVVSVPESCCSLIPQYSCFAAITGKWYLGCFCQQQLKLSKFSAA